MLYNILTTVIRPLLSLFFRVDVHGLDNIDRDRRFVICANHKSNWDPIMLAAYMPFEIHFMAKKELFENKLLGWILNKLNAFPVDREGSDIASLRNAVKLAREKKVVGIFIEGTRVKSFDPDNAKPGAIFTARMAKADILPIYIDTDYRIFKKTNIYIRP